MIRIFLFLLTLFMVSISTIGQTIPSPTLREQPVDSVASQLWELAIAAKGGREKLDSIENMVVSRRYRDRVGLLGRTEIEFEHFYVFPYKIWSWCDERPLVFGLSVDWADLEQNVRSSTTLVNEQSGPLTIKGSVYPQDKYDLRDARILYLMAAILILAHRRPAASTLSTKDTKKPKHSCLVRVVSCASWIVYGVCWKSHRPP